MVLRMLASIFNPSQGYLDIQEINGDNGHGKEECEIIFDQNYF